MDVSEEKRALLSSLHTAQCDEAALQLKVVEQKSLADMRTTRRSATRHPKGATHCALREAVVDATLIWQAEVDKENREIEEEADTIAETKEVAMRDRVHYDTDMEVALLAERAR